MATATTWIEGRQEAYNGCLVVMNIGNENIDKVPEEEKQKVVEAIADAHASGNSVIFMFDSDIGPQNPPEEFDIMEDRDGKRMAFIVLGMRTIKFSEDENERQQEMKTAAEKIRAEVKDSELKFIPSGEVRFCGYCFIGDKRIFLI